MITYTAMIAERDASDADVKAGASELLDFQAPPRLTTRDQLLNAATRQGHDGSGIDWDVYEVLAVSHPEGDLVWRSDRYCRIVGCTDH